jgi:hypothetical protein
VAYSFTRALKTDFEIQDVLDNDETNSKKKVLKLTRCLTMGLSGSLGSVITKFFSMRSNVVAKSNPWRVSLSHSARSQLSERSMSLVIKTSGSIGGGSSCFSAECVDLDLNLRRRKDDIAQVIYLFKILENDVDVSFVRQTQREGGAARLTPSRKCEMIFSSFWQRQER